MSAISDKDRMYYAMYEKRFGAKRVEPAFQPQAAPPGFVLALAERILAAHEVIGKNAERREWVLTERDYPLE